MSNRTNIRITTLTAALSLVLAAPTFADSQYSSGKGASQGMYKAQSVQAQAEAFDRYDTDRDGKLSRSEYQAMQSGQAQSGQTMQRSQSYADLFGRFDANRDGKLSRNEYQSLQQSLPPQTGGAMASTGSAWLANKSVKDLKGMDVKNQAGKEVGNISELVMSPHDNKVHAVISVGGFLGIGDTEIIMPLDQLTWQGDDNVILPTSASKRQLKARQDYNEDAYRELKDDQVIGQLGTSDGKQMQFSDLDANQDGHIDRSEFSAFESQNDSPSGSAAEPASRATGKSPGKSY